MGREVEMNIVKRTPFRDFENFMSGWRWPLADEGMDFSRSMTWRPSVDISEAEKEFLIKLEIPEVKKQDLKVEVENGILSVKGERREEVEDKKRHRSERFYGKFERSFTLPDNVREDGVKADMKDGMLYVHLNKTELPQSAKKHEIKVG